ncbi:unnamed protein product [Adineta steineri]|uniref:ADP ribosyltransferase domain-containing protein n=1 Tax=Adineta steineri TaxID=433720 RepID=A0A819R8I3_9BILA|nr:unnamed protein product [Adineta steineri]CAF4040518.1 unnamed protein product [Adineta steineri]
MGKGQSTANTSAVSKDVFTDITPICESLKDLAHQCEQNAIPMSFVGTYKKLNELDPSFMYTQIIKEIILTIKFKQNHTHDYFDYCRDAFKDNKKEMENIRRLESHYHNKTPIYWYTCDMFLYPMLNRALRLMNCDIITRMGFFICDLYQHIEQLHQEQYAGRTAADTFTVYCGQVLSTEDVEKMMEDKGDLISFNNFLSTSKDRNTSLRFAQNATINSDQIKVLFIMKINPGESTTPFASIPSISDFEEEEEVLFSMHSVFRIQDIKQMDGNNRLYEVNLTLTADNDPELNKLTDYIRQESYPDEEGWYRLGSVLIKMSQSNKAEDIYQVLLDQTNDDKDKVPIYHRLGAMKHNQEKHQEALAFYEKSIAIKNKTLPPNHPDLATSYHNIGNVHDNIGNYQKALLLHEKVLEIWQQSLPPNHPNLAKSYNNIGNVHINMGIYPEALLSHEKALEIRQQSLPPNHPDLASSYNNIGAVHYSMGTYPKALLSHEKALDIRQQSLPPNHPDLASSYNNIGNVHCSMSNYPKALLSHEKALEIRQQSLPPNHPDLASSFNNIGAVHNSMGNYSKALSSYKKALEIRQQSLPHNHPDLTSSYNNIGLVYYNMGDYPKALLYHEKALEIREQSLPPNHSDLASSYNNIGLVHYNMGNYPKSLSFHEKALEIREQSLPPNHSDLASSYNNMGAVHYSMGNYCKALLSYEKALERRQQSLPPNHPDLASSYNNIGLVYENLGNYARTRTFYEHAIQIGQQSLPSNHPRLQLYRNNLKDVQNK